MKLDKNRVYNYYNYSYKNFIQLSDEELLMILSWRNHEDIRNCMNTTETISEEEHLKFCHNLTNRDDVYYWMILKGEQPIGVFCIVNIDYEKGTCEPGFYLAPKVMGRGESIFVLSNYKDFLLNGLDFKGLIGHNYKDNKPSIVFTMFFGAEIIGIEEQDGRISIQSYLAKEKLQNGIGTERLVLKYTQFMRAWDTDKAINDFRNGK